VRPSRAPAEGPIGKAEMEPDRWLAVWLSGGRQPARPSADAGLAAFSAPRTPGCSRAPTTGRRRERPDRFAPPETSLNTNMLPSHRNGLAGRVVRRPVGDAVRRRWTPCRTTGSRAPSRLLRARVAPIVPHERRVPQGGRMVDAPALVCAPAEATRPAWFRGPRPCRRVPARAARRTLRAASCSARPRAPARGSGASPAAGARP
jgi:hypothetical protein